MGFSPQQVRQMSMWQYFAALEGVSEANDPDGDNRLSGTEQDELWAWISQG